jgi:hypothetical protein
MKYIDSDKPSNRLVVSVDIASYYVVLGLIFCHFVRFPWRAFRTILMLVQQKVIL